MPNGAVENQVQGCRHRIVNCVYPEGLYETCNCRDSISPHWDAVLCETAHVLTSVMMVKTT
jgi:hypothetical protein